MLLLVWLILSGVSAPAGAQTSADRTDLDRPTALVGWPKYPLWDERSGMKKDREIPVSGYCDPALTEVDHLVTDGMRRCGIPGGALCIMRNGKVLVRRAYGYSDKGLSRPMDPTALFRMASVEKVIISSAIGLVIRDGWMLKSGTRVTGDMRVFRVLQDECGLTPPEGVKPDPRIYSITINQLLAHKSGIGDSQAGWDVSRALNLQRAPNGWGVLRYVLGKRLLSEPGATFRYSSTGYDVLRFFVDYLTGDYLRYIRESIFGPAGTSDVVLSRTSPLERDPREPYYWSGSSGPSYVLGDAQRSVPLTEGGLNTDGLMMPAFSTEAMARYCSRWLMMRATFLSDPKSGAFAAGVHGTGLGVFNGAWTGTVASIIQNFGPSSYVAACFAFNYCPDRPKEDFNLLDPIGEVVRKVRRLQDHP